MQKLMLLSGSELFLLIFAVIGSTIGGIIGAERDKAIIPTLYTKKYNFSVVILIKTVINSFGAIGEFRRDLQKS